MMSKIGGVVGGGVWKYAHGTAHYGRNFHLKWLKVGLLFGFCLIYLGYSLLCSHDTGQSTDNYKVSIHLSTRCDSSSIYSECI